MHSGANRRPARNLRTRLPGVVQCFYMRLLATATIWCGKNRGKPDTVDSCHRSKAVAGNEKSSVPRQDSNLRSRLRRASLMELLSK
jgi:hypothetical protein